MQVARSPACRRTAMSSERSQHEASLTVQRVGCAGGWGRHVQRRRPSAATHTRVRGRHVGGGGGRPRRQARRHCRLDGGQVALETLQRHAARSRPDSAQHNRLSHTAATGGHWCSHRSYSPTVRGCGRNLPCSFMKLQPTKHRNSIAARSRSACGSTTHTRCAALRFSAVLLCFPHAT